VVAVDVHDFLYGLLDDAVDVNYVGVGLGN
jgi:hypothetical protein